MCRADSGGGGGGGGGVAGLSSAVVGCTSVFWQELFGENICKIIVVFSHFQSIKQHSMLDFEE